MSKCLNDFIGVQVDNATVFSGSNLDVLPFMADNSVDSIVTDPPYELGFMGKSWDNSGIAYSVELWTECMRVLKPGGHLLAFGGSRTWHRLAVAIEDAGFEMRDSIAWLYGSGFPKSMDISKQIDKNNGKHQVDLTPFGNYVRQLREAKGWSRKELDDLMGTNTAVSWWEGRSASVQLPSKETYERLKEVIEMDNRFDDLIDWAQAEREVIGKKPSSLGGSVAAGERNQEFIDLHKNKIVDITAPATDEAKQWQGWGTALKPAFEPVVVARKPLEEKTVAANVLKYGTGGLNIDGSRIGTEGATTRSNQADYPKNPDGTEDRSKSWARTGHGIETINAGRWPANIILDPYTAELLDEQSGISKGQIGMKRISGGKQIFDTGGRNDTQSFQTGITDSGGASRFFYVAKASKKDRNEGDANNIHPTVKPTKLMEYLIKLVTPVGGTVLDPFTGSGSTGKAALLNGFSFIGIELTEEYLPIIEGRLKWANEQVSKQEEEKKEVLF